MIIKLLSLLQMTKNGSKKVCDALIYLLDNIFIRLGTKVHRQTVGIPMGTNRTPVIADLFLLIC